MTYTVAVRALCEFTAREGDLDLRFTPGPSAEEGMAGHLLVASRRAATYQTEISLSLDFGALRVRGRADGYDPQRHQLEEIKTYRGLLSHIPEHQRRLHRAQAMIYGWLLCQQLELDVLRIAVVYFNIGTQKETPLIETCSSEQLQEFFESRCRLFLQWAEQEYAHREQRQQALSTLTFPHADFRRGQRSLAEAVYKVACTGQVLLAQAPTGIGKTVATLFPLLKAMPGQSLDKIFFLTAKTSGRRQALDALALLDSHHPVLSLRVLELVARDKACEHPDKACHGDSCPLAKSFYDRLPAARAALASSGIFGRVALRNTGLEHGVCPYYLQQELVRWSDVVVGDYNYFFDSHALLHGLTVANQWRVGVLVDEAHNLIERGRAMYTAQLDQAYFRRARKMAPASLRRALQGVERHWQELNTMHQPGYQVAKHQPDQLLRALQKAITLMTDYQALHPGVFDHELMEFYFAALQFTRLAESFDRHSLFDITLKHEEPNSSVLCLRNLIPGPFLGPRLRTAHTSTLFSATLSPWFFYKDMLGLPDNSAWLDVESPFAAAQLSVRVVSNISTRYQDRDRSLAPLLDLIASHWQEQPGNYLAFFSSFAYLQQAIEHFRKTWMHIPVWEQSRHMLEADRDAFLARFTPQSCGIGFAVLGGVFGEGIDLGGSRLIGAFIATLGLPQVNAVNEEIRQRMHELFGAGYDYTYLYPGLQKVVQAAGRVIRSENDNGVIFLLDDRFTRPEVCELLPRWWITERIVVPS